MAQRNWLAFELTADEACHAWNGEPDDAVLGGDEAFGDEA